MRVCLFEDQGVELLEPLTLCRPVFDLWCGASSLLQRHLHCFPSTSLTAFVRPGLRELCRLHHPSLAVNDLPYPTTTEATVLLNGRWLPPFDVVRDQETPRVALIGNDIAYVVLPPKLCLELSAASVEDRLQHWKEALPQTAAGGRMIQFPWDLVECNGDTLRQEFDRREGANEDMPSPAGCTIIGPANGLVIDSTVLIEPLVVIDTTQGPVFIDREARVQAFSRIEGPCYIGAKSWVLGAKVRGSTIGPMCRVGGEIEASILQGYSNKCHDGFLGHSYIGEWVNLGAGTQTSDLRNDYGPAPVTIAGQRIDTHLMKVGSFIGDHTKTGLNTLLNTGTMVGAYCNVLPTGGLLPQVIPSFCTLWQGQLQERHDLGQLLTTAATVMQRRGRQFTDTHAAHCRWLYQATAPQRRQAILQGKTRRRPQGEPASKVIDEVGSRRESLGREKTIPLHSLL